MARKPLTRDRILEVAARRFLRDGFANTRFEDIGKELGVSGPALYYHFDSKEQLLDAYVTASMAELVRTAEAAMTAADPAARVHAFVTAYVEFQLTQVKGPVAHDQTNLMTWLKPAARRRLAKHQRVFLDLLRSTIASGTGDGTFSAIDPSVAAFSIIGMAQHTIRWYRPAGRLTRADVSAQCAELALRMLGARLLVA